MKKLKPKPHQIWAWCSTLTILAGALTAALGLYPYYSYIFFIYYYILINEYVQNT